MKIMSVPFHLIDMRFCITLMCLLSLLFLSVYNAYSQEEIDFDEPLSIDKCVQIAKRHAPAMRTALYSMQAADANVLNAWANMMPSFNANVYGYRTTYGPRDDITFDQTTGQIIAIESKSYSLDNFSSGIGYGMSLFSKRNWSYLSQQQANQRASEFNMEVTEQDLVYRVKEAYYGLLAYQRLNEVNIETVKSREENLRKIESMFEVGSASKADVLKQKVQVQNARATLIQSRNDVDYAQANLAFTMGIDIDSPIRIVDILEIEETKVNKDEGLRFAMEYHPSLLSADAQVNATRAYVGYAKAAYWPSVGLGGSYSWGPDNKLSRISDMFSKNYYWNLGLQLSFEIPDFSTVANIRSAKAELALAQERFAETKSNITLAVKKAFLDLNANREIIKAREEEVASAEEDLKLAEERYRVGAGTALELIDAQVNYTSAQYHHVQALYNHKLALAQLEKAMGKATPE